MFVAAFDNRKQLPGYVSHFLRHTTRYTPIVFLTPASKGWLNQFPDSCEFLHPKKLPRFPKVENLFDQVFVNYSSNLSGFERACFLRWFALNAATTNLSDHDYVCLLDTDFILGVDPSALLESIHQQAGLDYGTLDFVSQWNPDLDHVAPELTIFKKRALFEFCLFLLTEFFDSNRAGDHITCYFNRIGLGLSGGVCDMTALASFLKEKRLNVFNLRETLCDEFAVISNFNSHVAEMAAAANPWEIFWDGDDQLLKVGVDVLPSCGIHFQGSAKRYIKTFAGRRMSINSWELY